MKSIKKIAIFLSVLLIFMLFSCANENTVDNDNSNTASEYVNDANSDANVSGGEAQNTTAE